MLGQMNYLSPQGIKKIDDYTIELGLNRPSLSVAYDISNYPGLVLPKGFGGDLTTEPIGTGPFLMKEYIPGQRARMVRREGYWRKGADGNPLPYLDEIVIVDLGDDRSAELAALRAGQIDTTIAPTVQMWQQLQKDPNFNITSLPTGASRILRVRADVKPWSDNRVRQALKYCHNRQKILATAVSNQGTIGNDSHVAPGVPDSSGLVAPYPFDPAKAKQMLADAGYPNGIKMEVTLPSAWPDAMAYIQTLKEDAAPGGFDISLNTVTTTQYWDKWLDLEVGVTWWAHRPLATMMLALAYTRDSTGKMVPWDETHWVDDEFDSVLSKAQQTLDLAERKKLVQRLEEIQKERGSICSPYYSNVWAIVNKRIKGVRPSKEEYALYHEAWVDPKA
jgi:peptide/nickel transport system substrate-binding protein